MSSDDIDNDSLDAFGAGEHALSRRLRGLPQPAPPAELDAAILARARAALAPARAEAANDPAPAELKLMPRPLSRRWRVPAGLAAMLLVGVLTQRSWIETGGMERVGAEADMPAPPAPAPAAAPAPSESEAATARPAPKRQAREQVVEVQIGQPSVPPAQEVIVPQAPVMVQESRPEAAIALPSRAMPAPVEAPPPPPPAFGLTEPAERAERPAPAPVPAPAAPAASAPAQGATPEAWLGLIDEMLKAGLVSDTLAEWDAFRAAHPDYPVDPTLAERISALRKR